MKIALLLATLTPYGGQQRDCLTVARQLAGRGHSVEILTARVRGPLPDDVAVRRVPVRALSNHGFDRLFARSAVAAARRAGFDLVVGFSPMADVDLCYCADVCYAHRASERYSAWYRLTPRYRAKARLERAVFDATSAMPVILLSEREAARFRQAHGTRAERLHIAPPGLDDRWRRPPSEPERSAALRAALGCPDDGFLLLLVAAAFHTKGLDRAIAALAALPEPLRRRAHLLAIGQAGGAQRYVWQGALLGVRRQIHIRPASEDITHLMQAADLLVHPARVDNTGTVILEALASGLPVLCTAACGYAGHVERSGAGRVVAEPFAQAELDAALSALLDAPTLAEMARHAHDYAARTDFHGGPVFVADIIERLAAAGRRSPGVHR